MKGKLLLSILGLIFSLILVSMVTAQAQAGLPPPPSEMKFAGPLPPLLTGEPLHSASNNTSWTQTNGPYIPGGQASALAAHPTTANLALAAVGPGSQQQAWMAPSHVYRTTDGGAHWTAVYTAPYGLSCLAFTDTIAYAGGLLGIHTSTDSGVNWTHVFTMDNGWMPLLFGLAANPQTPTTAFAAGTVITATESGTLYQATLHRTTDGGVNWTRVLTNTYDLNEFDSFEAVLVHPITDTIVLATYQNGLMLPEDQVESVILRSASGGDPGTWTAVLTVTDTLFTSLAFNPTMPDRIYATGYAIPFDGGMNLYRSDDAGENWTPVVTDGSAGQGLVVSADGSTLFGTSYRLGVVTGTAEGDIWSSGVWVPGPGWPQALTLDSNASPEKLYVGLMMGGVFTSTDGAASFSEANNGIEEMAVGLNLALHPSNPEIAFAAPSWCSSGSRTADAGDNWNRVEGTPNMIVFAFKPDAPDIMLGGGCNNCGASLLRSTDGGVNWTGVYTSPYVGGEWPDCGPGNSEIRSVTFARRQTNRTYAVGWEQTGPPTDTVEALLLRSTDGGQNWVRAYTWDLGWQPGLQMVAADPMDANVVYAGGGGCPPEEECQALLYKSSDGGVNWSPILTRTDTSYFASLVIDYWNPLVLYVADSNERVWKSSDGGENWGVIHESGWNDLPSGSALALDPWVPSILYVASTQHVIRSKDGGENFAYFGRLYELSGSPSLAIGNDASGTLQRLYAGSLGVWRYEQQPPGSRLCLPLVQKNY